MSAMTAGGLSGEAYNSPLWATVRGMWGAQSQPETVRCYWSHEGMPMR